jgi:hypothetical protein
MEIAIGTMVQERGLALVGGIIMRRKTRMIKMPISWLIVASRLKEKKRVSEVFPAVVGARK